MLCPLDVHNSSSTSTHTVSVHAPDVTIMTLMVESGQNGTTDHVVMELRGPRWHATFSAAAGDRYWLAADGRRVIDPSADDVMMTERGPVGVIRPAPWPVHSPLERQPVDPVVYELHLRGFSQTFAGAIERLPYLRDLGIDVIEVMPI